MTFLFWFVSLCYFFPLVSQSYVNELSFYQHLGKTMRIRDRGVGSDIFLPRFFFPFVIFFPCFPDTTIMDSLFLSIFGEDDGD